METVQFNIKDYEKANKYVQRFPIELTGLRPGEYAIGVQKATKGALLRNMGVTIPPYLKQLENVHKFPDLWSIFLTKLSSIPYFATMSNQEKSNWLFNNSESRDNYIHEIPGNRFNVLAIGNKTGKKTQENKFYEKLTDNEINILLADPQRVWTGEEIMNMFPRKAGSKAKRHVLIFNKFYWQVHLAYEESNSYNGIVIDVHGGIVRINPAVSTNQKIITLNNIFNSTIGFIVDKSSSYNDQDVLNLIFNFYPRMTMNDINNIKLGTKNFTPAGYKSLLQKIIRYRPNEINFHIAIYPAGFSLITVIALLIINPGSFVPDIQRYVSGLESASKRLAVSIFEDTSIPIDRQTVLVSLLASSLLRQRVKSWKPSLALIQDWLTLALQGLESTNYYSYDFSQPSILDERISLSPRNTPLLTSSLLLEEIKSFKTDINMVRQIAINNGFLIQSNNNNFPSTMAVEHCIDQHWTPAIVYYYPTYIIGSLMISGNKQFSQVFEMLFKQVTGVNSRKKVIDNNLPFVQASKRAQLLVLKAIQSEPNVINIQPGETDNFTFSLPKSWIAGMLGPIEVTGQPTALVTMDPNNLNELIAIRRPSRGMKDSQLTIERQRQAINEARSMLMRGLPLNKSKSPIDLLKDATIRLVPPDRYIIRTGVSTGSFELEIDSLKDLKTEISYVYSIGGNDFIENSINWRGEGILSDSSKQVKDLIRSTPINYVRRALVYISHYRHEFEMNPVSRDGSGTQQMITLDDVGAYHFLLKLSLIYPIAFSRVKYRLLDFNVMFPPLFWSIRDYIAKSVLETGNIDSSHWGNIYDTARRRAEDYQTSSLQEMINRKNNNKRGNFLWIKQGLGKTFIVMSFLKYLVEHNLLPLYIIYILPESAIESIIKEVQFFNFKVELLWPIHRHPPESLSGIINTSCVPTPYHITLIEHDKFKSDKCMKELSKVIKDSMFIVDEVHKTLNDTIRTTKALELSHMAQDFIAFTGTPVIDDKIYKLINWLEQIVSFEVNPKNFFVAVNSMIAKSVDTGIQINRLEVIAQFTPLELQRYQSVVSPNLGGHNMSGTNVQEAMDICYQAATREMVGQIINHLNNGISVMAVARNNTHQGEIYQTLTRNGINQNLIFNIGTGSSLFLTDDTVAKGETPDYRVIITTMRHVLGYTVTRVHTMITSVYPSNNADREQLEGRINRLGQQSPTVTYITIHLGILTNILRNYDEVRNLSDVLKTLAIK